MAPTIKESKFEVSRPVGSVSYILQEPKDQAALLVLAHGAGAGMRHPHMQALADALSDVQIGTFRYQFPYMERGRGRDAQPVVIETVRRATEFAAQLRSGVKLLAGGHSFGGRMTSLACAGAPLNQVCGLVFFSFPLHPPQRPSIVRADHLEDVDVPMLFLSGSRDNFTDGTLLEEVCTKLGRRATLHRLDSADHGFKILRRKRRVDLDVYEEAALTAAMWLQDIVLTR